MRRRGAKPMTIDSTPVRRGAISERLSAGTPPPLPPIRKGFGLVRRLLLGVTALAFAGQISGPAFAGPITPAPEPTISVTPVEFGQVGTVAEAVCSNQLDEQIRSEERRVGKEC